MAVLDAPMLPELLAMVAHHDDDGVLPQAPCFDRAQDTPYLPIDLGHLGAIQATHRALAVLVESNLAAAQASGRRRQDVELRASTP